MFVVTMVSTSDCVCLWELLTCEGGLQPGRGLCGKPREVSHQILIILGQCALLSAEWRGWLGPLPLFEALRAFPSNPPFTVFTHIQQFREALSRLPHEAPQDT